MPIGKNSVGEILVGADEELRLRLQILTNSTKRDIMLTKEKCVAIVKEYLSTNPRKDVVLQVLSLSYFTVANTKTGICGMLNYRILRTYMEHLPQLYYKASIKRTSRILLCNERAVSLMFSAHDVAIYIINWCLDHSIQITNLKLQKLLYFVQGEYSNVKGTRLISDDFYAWQLGPVVPTVYAEYSIFSSSALPAQKQTPPFDEEETYVIDAILQKYAHYTTWNLVELSHQQDPWKYHHEIFGDKAPIPYESIADYFGEGKAV